LPGRLTEADDLEHFSEKLIARRCMLAAGAGLTPEGHPALSITKKVPGGL
jgi:hypothetical protein